MAEVETYQPQAVINRLATATGVSGNIARGLSAAVYGNSQPPSPIEQEIDRLRNKVVQLQVCEKSLRTRLDAVLCPSQPTETLNRQAPVRTRSGGSATVTNLEAVNEDLESLTEAFRDILSRLEV